MCQRGGGGGEGGEVEGEELRVYKSAQIRGAEASISLHCSASPALCHRTHTHTHTHTFTAAWSRFQTSSCII